MSTPVWMEVGASEYVNIAAVRRIKFHKEPGAVQVEYVNGDGATIPLDPRLHLFWLDYLFNNFRASITRRLEAA